MDSETKPLTGDELRKAVLTLLGYNCIHDEKGYHIDIKGFKGGDYETEEQVWKHADPVEINLGEAYRRLPLADGLQWLLESPQWVNGNLRGLAVAELVVSHSMARVATAEHESMATAMCQAWLEWKMA